MRLALVVLAGCSFRHGELANSDAPEVDPHLDAAVDGAVSNCYARWFDHSVRFGAPQPLSVNTTGYERDPFLTADEQTLYFSAIRGATPEDVYFATRTGTGFASFTTAQPFTDVNSSGGETKLSLTANGLVAVVGSTRGGGSGGVDVWETSRMTTATAFPSPTRDKVMAIETSANEHDPTISADGLHLYFAPDLGAQHIELVTRATVNDNFAAPAPLPELTSGTGDADPSPTPDERIIMFSSNRALAGAMPSNIWYATRGAKTMPFEAPIAVPDINSDFPEGDPHLSSDGCRIYFARYSGAGLDWNLYVAAMQ